MATNGNSSRVTVFSVRSPPRCYKQDSWCNGLVLEQSTAGKNMSTKAEGIVWIRHQAMTGEHKLVTVLQLLVVTICKCSINLITNPNHIYNHPYA
jgi:hypothetical protein